jgi:hypothetical protein
MAVPEPSFDAEGRLFCYALTDDLWVIGGAISNGGITLRWAGETFAPDLVAEGHADVDVLKLAAQAPPGSDGLLMLPYVLSGVRRCGILTFPVPFWESGPITPGVTSSALRWRAFACNSPQSWTLWTQSIMWNLSVRREAPSARSCGVE